MDPARLGRVNSAELTPMRSRRHCRRSVTEVSVALGGAPAAAIAILGSEAALGGSLSELVLGRRVRFLSVRLLTVHAFTEGIVTWRRHLPTCMTNGILVPEGASVRVK